MALVVALFSVSSGRAPLRDKTTNGYKGDLALVLTDKQTNESDKNTVELYTAVSRKVVEKVHATIPKGIMGGFEFTVLQRNLKEWHERPWTYVCKY